VPCKG